MATDQEAVALQTKTGFVALLDVLGFRQIAGNPRRLDEYLRAVDAALTSERKKDVEYVIFSDSIVLTTVGDDVETFRAIARACSGIFHGLLQVNIAVRGAVSFGEFSKYKSSSGVFVAGQPIVDAYEYEKIQDWVGVMLTPKVLERVPELVGLSAFGPTHTANLLQTFFAVHVRFAALVQPAAIPFHRSVGDNDRLYQAFAVVPTDGSPDPRQLSASIQASRDGLDRLARIAPTPDAQAKYEAAGRWLFNIASRWQTLEGQMREFGVEFSASVRSSNA